MKRQTLNLIGVFSVVLFFQACAKINPDEIGVRTVNFGPSQGIVQKDYAPGYHRYLWPLDSWHRFPRTVQRIQFMQEGAVFLGQVAPTERRSPLLITSSDGDRVTMNAEVIFRIADGRANFVLQDSGPGERMLSVVRNLTVDEALKVFGKLQTESFYEPEYREAAREDINNLLRERLAQRGIELVNFLVISIRFDPRYEALIQQKKIADQTVELEQSRERAAEERAKVEMIRQETQILLQQIERETEAQITQLRSETDLAIAEINSEAQLVNKRLRADADLFREQKRAEGQRLLKAAEAEGTKRLNAALTGDGGRNLAALEAARNLQLVDVVFPSLGFDWFNPNEMATHLGAELLPAHSPDEDRRGVAAQTPRLNPADSSSPSQDREE